MAKERVEWRGADDVGDLHGIGGKSNLSAAQVQRGARRCEWAMVKGKPGYSRLFEK